MSMGWAIAILLFGAIYLVVFFIRTIINERRKDCGENADKGELDYSQICWASAKCKFRTRDGNCKLDHCVR